MCKFCEAREDNVFAEGYVESGHINSTWAIGDNKDYFCLEVPSGTLFHFRGDGQDWGYCYVRYCPMCGRKLTIEPIEDDMWADGFPITDEDVLALIK